MLVLPWKEKGDVIDRRQAEELEVKEIAGAVHRASSRGRERYNKVVDIWGRAATTSRRR